MIAYAEKNIFPLAKFLFEFIEYRNPGITRTVLNELNKKEGGHEKLASTAFRKFMWVGFY